MAGMIFQTRSSYGYRLRPRRVGYREPAGRLRGGQPGQQKPKHEALDTQIDVGLKEKKCVVYAVVFGVELQQCIVSSQ